MIRWIEIWAWDRQALVTGEWWRWLTGHLVHLNAEHAVMNALGAGVLWWLFHRDFLVREIATIILISLTTTNLGLWYLSNLSVYVGSSALLHGVAAAGILRMVSAGERWGVLLALLGLIKLGVESLGDPDWLSPGYRVAAEAHLFGVVGGLLGAFILWALRRRRLDNR